MFIMTHDSKDVILPRDINKVLLICFLDPMALIPFKIFFFMLMAFKINFYLANTQLHPMHIAVEVAEDVAIAQDLEVAEDVDQEVAVAEDVEIAQEVEADEDIHVAQDVEAADDLELVRT